MGERESRDSQEVTRLLIALGDGDESAADRLLPLVYAELRQLARARMARERPGQTLEPTALVHEAFLRLVSDPAQRWNGRAHFFGAAAEAMRRIMIERARSRATLKRGGERPVSLEEDPPGRSPGPDDVLALDDALRGLQAIDPRMALVVKLRCFVGLSIAETAEAMEDASERTVSRLWMEARAWLRREMRRGKPPD